MARTKAGRRREQLKKKIVTISAQSFIRYGYGETTIKSITAEAGISTGSFNNLYQTKEDVLCELVEMVLERQFEVAGGLMGKTDDKLLYYAMETTLQLHIVEMDEKLREVYSAAYSLPKPSAVIQKIITAKLEDVFKDYHPEYETKDFYKLEIATGGIMRGFMSIPCDMWFTMDQKIESFLGCTFKLYDVPKQKIAEAVAYVKQYDFKAIARQTIDGILSYLETQTA